MIVPLSLAAALVSAPMPCSLPTGWSEIAAKRARFILFGETHGTRQSPELVGSVACALASKGHRVLVGVELNSSNDPKLQQLWNTPGKGFAAHVLNDLPGFAAREDGVGSEAMLALLDKLHRLTLAGKKVDVVAFNPSRAQEKPWAKLPGQGAHEAGQAANIAAAAARRHYDEILILVGNAHAQKQPVDFSGVSYAPMAMHLASAGPVLTLEEKYASGTMWNCLFKAAAKGKPGSGATGMKPDCGVHKTGGSPVPPKTQVGLWTKAQNGWDSGYDGYFWFAVVDGSPPAGKGAGD